MWVSERGGSGEIWEIITSHNTTAAEFASVGKAAEPDTSSGKGFLFPSSDWNLNMNPEEFGGLLCTPLH